MKKYKRYWELDKQDNVPYSNKDFYVGLSVIITIIILAVVVAMVC